jgi:hypothetical protein
MLLFDFLVSRKEFNVYQHDIHIFMIFMNMIIWPLMTYTVTSFGKAFALKIGVGRFNIFLKFLQKSCWILLCRFRVESVNIFIYNMCFFQQTISHMRKRFTEWGHCVGHQWSYDHIHEYHAGKHWILYGT